MITNNHNIILISNIIKKPIKLFKVRIKIRVVNLMKTKVLILVLTRIITLIKNNNILNSFIKVYLFIYFFLTF